jgi:hypothetical protein
MEIYGIFMLKTFSFYISNVYISILSRINFDIRAYFHFVVRNCDARILKVMRILDFLCVFYAYTHAIWSSGSPKCERALFSRHALTIYVLVYDLTLTCKVYKL